MVQDESHQVIVLLCPHALVGEIVRQLRLSQETDDVAVLLKPVGTPARLEARSIDSCGHDSDRMVALLREQHALTDMQCVVLALRFRGLSLDDVAFGIGIARATVKRHVHDAKERLGEPRRSHVDALFRRMLRELPAPNEEERAEIEASEWNRMTIKAMRHVASKANATRADPLPLRLAGARDSMRAATTQTSRTQAKELHPVVQRVQPEAT